jgi:S-DNA-T family DNA segregation ATPase FtsK/SpoIIIE
MRTTATHHDIETAHLAGVQPDDPLAADVDYPWDAPVSRTSIPFGVDSEQRPIMLGLLGSGQLLAGRTGSGKSAGLATLLCGIARLENVTLVGFDHSKFELAPWKSRFSRIAGEHESVSVLEAIIEEMDRRYTWLAEHDLKTVAPGQMSPTMPLIVVVIAELAELVNYGCTVEEKVADIARAAMIRRIAAKGRAAGVVMIVATQNSSSRVLPGELHDLIGGRVSYATTTSGMTDTILGAGMSKLGGLSHEIPAELKGVCYIVSETSRVPLRARIYYIPDEPAEEGAKSPVRLIAEGLAHLRIELPWMPVEAE